MMAAFTALDVTFKNGDVNTYSASETKTHYYFNDNRFYRCLTNFTRPQIWMEERLNWVEYEGITSIRKVDLGQIIVPGTGLNPGQDVYKALEDIVQAVQLTADTINKFYDAYKANMIAISSNFDELYPWVEQSQQDIDDLERRMNNAESEISSLDDRVTALENK